MTNLHATRVCNASGLIWLRRISRFAPALSTLLLLTSAHAALFNGQQVSVAWYDPDLSTQYQAPVTGLVGSGVEFSNYASGNPAFNIDFTDNTIEIDAAQSRPPAQNFGAGAFNGLVITAGGSIPNLASVTLTTSNWLDGSGRPFGASRVTFDATHIYIDFSNMALQVGYKIVVTAKASAPAVNLTSSLPSPSSFGRALTLTATLIPAATGTVAFFADGVFLGSSAVSGNQAAITTRLLPARLNRIKAYYSGDADFQAGSGTLSQSVLSSIGLGFRANPVPYHDPSGTGQQHIVTADFTGDGIPDVATADSGGNLVTVFKGNGDGIFSYQSASAVGSGPCALAAGDLNADGNIDLVALDCTAGTISVMLGDGTGSFPSGSSYSTTLSGLSGGIVLADLNGDSLPDISVVQSGVGSVAILRGTGAGVFLAATTYPGGGSNPVAIAAADFNNDGNTDLAVVHKAENSLVILTNSGTGTFPSATPVSTNNNSGALGLGPVALAVGDLNGDGKPDIVTANNGSGTVSVFVNTSGSFPANPNTIVPLTSGASGPSAVALVDLDGNAILDIVTANQSTNNISYIPGTGGATFAAPASNYGPGGAGQANNALAAGDFNGDGVTDVVTANSWVPGIEAFLGIGTSSTSLTLSPSPSVYGQSVAMTATMTPSTATGTVIFFDGSSQIGSPVTLANGTAVLNYATLAQGSHNIFALYSGDPGYAASASSPQPHTVNQGSTTHTLTSNLNSARFGQQVTLTATVSPTTGSVAPTGSVQFVDGGVNLGSPVALNGSGVATFTTTEFTVGDHALQARYAGDSNYNGSNSNGLTETIIKATTTTTLTSSANQSGFTRPVTLTATVSPSPAGGSVVFSDGATPLATVNLSAGSAAFTTSAFALGAHNITAAYSGDASDLASTSAALTQTVAGAGGIIFSSNFENGPLVSSDTNWASNTFGLVVPDPLNASNHVLEFTDTHGAGDLFSVPLPAAASTYYLSFDYLYPDAPYGGAFIGVDFPDEHWLGGDCGGCFPAFSPAMDSGVNHFQPNQWNHVQIQFPQFNAVSNFALKIEQFTGAAPNALFDNIVISTSGFTAPALTLTPSPLSGMASHTPYSATLASGGVAPYTCAVTSGTLPPPLALDPVTCVLSGSPSSTGAFGFAVSVTDSEIPAQTISLAYSATVAAQTTTTTIDSSPNPSALGQAVQFTATVSSVSASGTVTFIDGSTIIGTAPLSSGTATFSTNALTGGTHLITASYDGDSNNAGSASLALSQAVNRAVTTTSLLSSLNPSPVGAPITLTAAVLPVAATGTIQFLDGSTPLGSPVALVSGVASFNTSSLSVGAHTLTASYSGDSSYAPGVSSNLSAPLNFFAAAPGTILDSAGHGTGFTSRLPGTGGSLAANDPNLTLNTVAGTVSLRSTGSDLNGQGNLGAASFVGIPLSSVGIGASTDFAVSAAFKNVQYSQAYDQFGLFAGSASTSTFRVGGLATPSLIAYTVQTNGTGDSNLQQSSTFAPTAGDNVIFTLSRTAGTWAFAINNLTHPAKSGSVGVTQPAYLAGNSSLIVGIYATNPGNAASKTETISAFSIATPFQNVLATPTTTTLGTSANPGFQGLPLTLTATITPSSATGTVNFSDGSTSIGSGTLANGVATFTTSSLALGAHSLTAAYAGDTTNASSTSSVLSQSIIQANTTTRLTSSANPATPSTQVLFTANVTPSNATGSVTFKDGTTSLGNAALNNGVASFGAFLTTGTHSVTATYNGDATHSPSISPALGQNVSYPSPVILTSSLPPGQAGSSYGPVTLAASGGSGTFRWTASGLPAGLSMSSGGTIAGTPTTGFSGTVFVSLTDTVSNLGASQQYSLTISSTLTITGNSNLGAAVAGHAISGSFTASGGTPPYTWALSGAPGFSVDGAGKVTGTAGPPGTFNASLSLADSTGQSTSLGITWSGFGITTSSLPPATITGPYNATITAAGGTATYTFTISGLPPGLSASGGTITGQPATPGTSSISVQATDGGGLSVTANLSLTVTGATPLSVLTSSLPNGIAGQPYSQTLAASGGSPAYTWAFSGGALPSGLTLSASGTVAGQTANPGTYVLGSRVTDTAGANAVGSVSLTILPAPLTITNGSTLPSGMANVDYPGQILAATGGVAPYTFTIKSGSLAAGMTLSGGQLQGTPAASGNFNFTVGVADSATPPSTGSLAMSVAIRPNAPDLVLSTASVSFALTAGTSAPPAGSAVNVTSSISSQILNFTTATTAPWLNVTGGSSTPGALSIALTNAALTLTASGSPYTGTVTVTCTSSACSGNSQKVTVTITITSAPPQLGTGSQLLSFSSPAASPSPQSTTLSIQNTGGGTLGLTSITAADPWISAGSFPSTIVPGPGAAVGISIDPTGLRAGFYTSSIQVASSAGSTAIPVTLLVSAKSSMALGPAGAQFSLPQGGAPGVATGSFLVNIASDTPVAYTATILPGASWLTGGGTGSASSTSPGSVTYSLNAAVLKTLPSGAYYATIRVAGDGIVNTPLDYQVVVAINPASTPVVPVPQPAGLIFLSSK